MKIVKQRVNRKGELEITVVTSPKEKILVVHEDRFYKLGGQVEDVVGGHVLVEMENVRWCSIAQEWVS